MTGSPDGKAPLRYSIVLPTHNEEELLNDTVTHLIEGMAQRGVPYEIIIVENGSSDRTPAIAASLVHNDSRLSMLSLPIGDYGAAMEAGFRAAKGEIIVSFDVDYYDLAFLDAAGQMILTQGVDYVMASKRAPGARDQRPIIRRILTYGFTTLLRFIVNLPVSDAHGIKAIRRSTVAPLIDDCQTRGSMFDVELICRAGRAGLQIKELPASVVELRPPRTALARRALEGLTSMIRLRRVLRAESRARR